MRDKRGWKTKGPPRACTESISIAEVGLGFRTDIVSELKSLLHGWVLRVFLIGFRQPLIIHAWVLLRLLSRVQGYLEKHGERYFLTICIVIIQSIAHVLTLYTMYSA